MFIRKSTHLKIVEDLHYSYGRKEASYEQKIKKLRVEKEYLRIRMNKALVLLSSEERKLIDYIAPKEVERPSRSGSVTSKVQSQYTPEVTNSFNITPAILFSSLMNSE